MINDSTKHLHLPLPHKDNYLEDDVSRLRDAFIGVDTFAQNTSLRVTEAEQGLTRKADAATTTTALQTLGARVDQVAGSIPKLSNAVNSALGNVAASSLAVKTAYDRGTAGVNAAAAAHGAANAAQGTANAALVAAGQGFIAGGIVPFSGGFGGSDGKRPIPRGKTVADEGWVLCDGSNGTPNLKDRFIVGAGASYGNWSTGGSVTHAHAVSGSAGSTTLSTYEMPSHSHLLIGAGDGGYTATGLIAGGDGVSTRYGGCFTINAQAMGATGSSGYHTHSLSASAATANGLPPYFALSYIMKL